MARPHAGHLKAFNHEVLSPCLNYPLPCFFPREQGDARGRVRKRYHYEDMHAPTFETAPARRPAGTAPASAFHHSRTSCRHRTGPPPDPVRAKVPSGVLSGIICSPSDQCN